jgi:hypothetical protein
MDRRTAVRRSHQVGLGSLAIGATLALRPRLGRFVDLGDRETLLVGVADILVGAGLVRGRSPRPWIVARAGTNLAIAGLLLRQSSREARTGALGLCLVTVADLQMARALR